MEANSSTDLFQNQPTRPAGGLKVLTTLTFIGCGLAYIGALWSFFQSTGDRYERQLATLDQMRDGNSGFASKIAEQSYQTMIKTHDYRYVLLVAGLLFTTLCLVGAMQMRQQKKSGFPLYVVGELAPLVVSIGVLGFSTMLSAMSLLLGAVIAILFVILYAAQRKNMIY